MLTTVNNSDNGTDTKDKIVKVYIRAMQFQPQLKKPGMFYASVFVQNFGDKYYEAGFWV